MKSRAPWTAVKMAELDNGCLQGNCEYIDIKTLCIQKNRAQYLKVTPKANQVLVMYIRMQKECGSVFEISDTSALPLFYGYCEVRVYPRVFDFGHTIYSI